MSVTQISVKSLFGMPIAAVKQQNPETEQRITEFIKKLSEQTCLHK